MKEILDKAKKCIVVTNHSADFDEIVASISLARTLQDDGKDVSLLLPKGKYTESILKIFPLQDLKLVEIEKNRHYIIKIKKEENSIVKEVKWKEDKGRINIYISTTKGEIDTSRFSIKTRPFVVDLVILVNVSSIKKFGKRFYTSFKKTQILQIGYPEKKIGAFCFPDSNKVASFLVYLFLKRMDFVIQPNVATNLISGILWKTNGFKQNYSLDSLKALYQLSEVGNFQLASKNAFKNLGFKDLRLISEILKNLVVTENNVAYAIVKSGITKADIETILYPNWLLFDDLSDMKLVFVLFKIGDEIWGVVRSNAPRFNAKEIVVEFANIKGDEHLAQFTSKKSIDEVKDLILFKTGHSSNSNLPNATSEAFDPLAPAKESIKPLELDNLKDI